MCSSDLYDRGLDRKVLRIVTGEFGRTPRISYANGTQTGVKQPGRDHWPSAMSVLVSGGGMRTGQVIGSTNRLGEYAKDRPVTFGEIFATLYANLGIDPSTTTINDPSGRPQHVVEEPALKELV